MSCVNLYLDNHQYYPEHIITGKAVCHFRSEKEVRKIRIRLKGHEHTHWTGTESYYDSSSKKTRTRTVYYSGDNDVLFRDLIVHGPGTIGPGEHVFPFQFQLPENLPSTFQCEYGDITYSVKVTVDREWKTDFEDKKIITIISPIKLENINHDFRQPAEYSDEKTVCCFCCASGPVQLDVNLEKRAFVVGEHVGVKLYCLNMSNTNVDSLNVTIKMKMTFRVTSPTSDHKYDSELVASSYNSGVGAHGDKTFSLGLEIPPSTVVPNFTGCELFQCSHELEASASISGCHSDLDITTNVAIGHVPYPQAPVFNAPLQQSAPPYPAEGPMIDFPETANGEPPNGFQPMPMPMPMHMPMPMPGKAGDTTGIPPYPIAGYPPTAPHEAGAPSAPPKLDTERNPAFSGAGNSSAYESPPPTYDEAAKHFK